MTTSPRVRILLGLCLALLLCPPAWAQGNGKGKGGGPRDPEPPPPASELSAASALAHDWLRSQMLPNGMVNSYADGEDVCYTYDQGVAAIAFLARNDVASARAVLDVMAGLQQPDGSWPHAYLCSTQQVLAAQTYVGAVSWMVLAAAHYQARTGDPVRYRMMAESALYWAVAFMRGDGGINGGRDAAGVPFDWASTEHNQDALAGLAFFDFAQHAAAVHGFLTHAVWDAAEGRWWQGRDDAADPLDVNPLGVMLLADASAPYGSALQYALQNHRSVQRWGKGRDRANVDGFDFNRDANDIWLEGTAQMAAALRVLGRTEEAAYFTAELVKTQEASGGLPYSVNGSHNGDFRMSTAPAVAATGWFILAAEQVNPMRP
jgi:hypothetical protein